MVTKHILEYIYVLLYIVDNVGGHDVNFGRERLYYGRLLALLAKTHLPAFEFFRRTS